MTSDASKLSKNLLRMKFMQRGLDADTKKLLEEEERRIISDEHWYLDLPELKAKENVIIEENSFVPCEDLKYGRMSFKGFNPEVEKLMVLMNTLNEEEVEEEEEITRMETDVTDEQMARRYESLVASMKKKFVKKRARPSLEKQEEKQQQQQEQQEQEEEEEEDANHNVGQTKTKRAFLKPQD